MKMKQNTAPLTIECNGALRLVRPLLLPIGRMPRDIVPLALKYTHPDGHLLDRLALPHHRAQRRGDVGIVVHAVGIVFFECDDFEVGDGGDDP